MKKNIYKLELTWPIEFIKLNEILNSNMQKTYTIYQENEEYCLVTNTKELAIKLQENKIAKILTH
jgi:hypothetical protein